MDKEKAIDVKQFSTAIYNEVIKPTQTLSEEEHAYKAELLKKMFNAFYMRERGYDEFNGQSYIQRYISNQRVAIAFNKLRENADETEIVSGSTHQKMLTLLNAILSYKYEPKIMAYDNNSTQYTELASIIKDIVDKTLENEHDDEKQVLELLEYISQGDVFTEEVIIEELKVIKKCKKKYGEVGFDWETTIKKMLPRAERIIHSGLNVFLGNIREFFIDKQPYIFTVDLISYEEAKKIYGDLPQFQFVSRFVTPFNSSITFRDKNGTFALFSNNVVEGLVEVVKYQDKFNNEYQIFLNGIMMLPVKLKKGCIEGFPLSYVSPSGEFTISKGSGEPLSAKFAYSKSIVENMKFIQEVKDEMIRLMVLKTQQSFRKPTSNLSGKDISSINIFSPGIILDGIRPDQLPPLGDFNGVTQSEVQMLEIVNQLLQDNSVADLFDGQDPKGDVTAAQIQAQQKQSLMKLGVIQIGWVSLKKQQCWKRVYSVLEKYTQPLDPDMITAQDGVRGKYRAFTMETTLSTGKNGIRLVKFNKDRANQGDEATNVEAKLYSDKYKKDVNLVYIDPSQLRATMEWIWFVSIEPTPTDTTELRKAQFLATVMQLFQIPQFAQSLNIKYIGDKIATDNDLDADQLFQEAQQQPQPQYGAEQGGQAQGQIPGQQSAGVIPGGKTAAQMQAQQKPSPLTTNQS